VTGVSTLHPRTPVSLRAGRDWRSGRGPVDCEIPVGGGWGGICALRSICAHPLPCGVSAPWAWCRSTPCIRRPGGLHPVASDPGESRVPCPPEVHSFSSVPHLHRILPSSSRWLLSRCLLYLAPRSSFRSLVFFSDMPHDLSHQADGLPDPSFP
jgi:hypothetical protein